MAFPPAMEVELTAEESGDTQGPGKEESRGSVDAVQRCFQLGFAHVGDFIVSVQNVWHCTHIPPDVRDKLAVFVKYTWPVIEDTTKMMHKLERVLDPLYTAKYTIAQIFDEHDDLTLRIAIKGARKKDREVDLTAIMDQIEQLALLIDGWQGVQERLGRISEEMHEVLPHMKEVGEHFETCHKSCARVIIGSTMIATSMFLYSGALGELPQQVSSLIAAYPGSAALTVVLSSGVSWSMGRSYLSVTDRASRVTVNFLKHLLTLDKNADLAYEEVAKRVEDLEMLYAAVEDMVDKTTAVHTVVSASHAKEQRLSPGIRAAFMTALREDDADAALSDFLELMGTPKREEFADIAKDDLDKIVQILATVADWKQHSRQVRLAFIDLQTKVECDVGSTKYATLETTARKDD